MRRKRISLLRLGVLCSIFIIFSGCAGICPPRGVKPQTFIIETTGYCACGKCCGWHRSWKPPFKPVYSSGSLKGKPKEVGVTASGTQAKKGTVAADTRFYPFGTIMDVPGYGLCRVEDRGGAIQGPARIDLFFSSHKEALKWGRKRVSVHVWR
ncbi:MAG: 3D domain-containing protein [Victivallales bacterium]|nr:3D domain-containing protein [Victivallales bacterium]